MARPKKNEFVKRLWLGVDGTDYLYLKMADDPWDDGYFSGHMMLGDQRGTAGLSLCGSKEAGIPPALNLLIDNLITLRDWMTARLPKKEEAAGSGEG